MLSTNTRTSRSIGLMMALKSDKSKDWKAPAWFAAALTGSMCPLLAVFAFSETSSSQAFAGGPPLTLSLMGIGILTAAIVGRFWVGVLLALINTALVMVIAKALGLLDLPHPLSTLLAMAVASCSFAARGALFARTLSERGWWMGLFVVLGEASVLLIVSIFPGALPNWFLALLPAQWASIAIQTALTGTGTVAAMPVLLALAGTAATTLLAAKLWLRRWPYLLMFAAWLGLSAFVYLSLDASNV